MIQNPTRTSGQLPVHSQIKSYGLNGSRNRGKGDGVEGLEDGTTVDMMLEDTGHPRQASGRKRRSSNPTPIAGPSKRQKGVDESFA